MTGLIKSLAAAVALTVSATAANAADIYRGSTKDAPDAAIYAGPGVNWSGCYFGGQAGYGNANHKAEFSISDGERSEGAFIDGLNSHGFFGGGTIGCDVARGNLLFGVFGDYNFSNAVTTVGLGGDELDIIQEGDSWVVAARAGYLFGQEKRALLYVLGGYGQADVDYSAGGDATTSATFSGFVAGAGGEYALTQNVFIGIEWQHFFGGKETLVSERFEGLTAELTDDMDTDKVMAKLKFKLNAGLPYLGD